MGNPDAGAPAIAAAPGNQNTVALATAPFALAKIVSLKVVGDHGLLLDNEADLRPQGQPYPVPHFSYGKRAAALSIQMGRKIRVELELELWPYQASSTKVDLLGAAWGFTFSSARLDVKGGKQTVTLESTVETPKETGWLAGDFEMEVRPEGQPSGLKAEHAWGFQILDTIGTPKDPTTPKDVGITTARMLAAVKRVAASGSVDGHGVAAALFKLVPYYVLSPARDTKGNLLVPAEYNHPSYINDVGGAWHLDNYLPYYAECQAIVRWALAIMKIVGVPCNGMAVVVWADPNEPGSPPRKDPYEHGGLHAVPLRTVGGETQWAALMDSPVVVGGVYQSAEPAEPHYCGANAFEACGEITANGQTRLYEGGGGAVFKDPSEVIQVFYSLTWVAEAPPIGAAKRDAFAVREIVRKFR